MVSAFAVAILVFCGTQIGCIWETEFKFSIGFYVPPSDEHQKYSVLVF